MTIRTRTRQRLKARLEGLEPREAPAVGLAGAWHAALAQPWAHALRGGGFQSVHQGISTPHFPFTDRAGAPGREGPLNPSRAPNNPTFKPPVFNRPALPRAWGTRTLMRTPVPVPVPAPPITPVSTPPTTPVTPMTNPDSPNANAGTPTTTLPPNVSGVLNALYQDYQRTTTVPVSDAPGAIVIEGTNVGVSFHGNGQGSFSTLLDTLRNLGMQISATDDVSWTVAGMLPISQLPTAAQTPQTLSITPMYRPFLRSSGGIR